MRIASFLGVLLVTGVTTGCVTRVRGEAHVRAEPARVRVVHHTEPVRVRVVTRAAPPPPPPPPRVHVEGHAAPPPPPQVHVEVHAAPPPPPQVHVEAHGEAHAGGSVSTGSSGHCPPGHVWSDGKCHSTGKGNDPNHHKK